MLKKLSLAAVLALSAFAAQAADPAIGLWTTIDDETGKARSVVEVFEKDGELQGKIIEVIGEAESDVCTECEGELKDHPIVGLPFMWGLQKDGSKWDDGKILDPNNGKVYSSKLQVSEDGKTLEVRGYVGFSLLGRSQTWHRKQ